MKFLKALVCCSLLFVLLTSAKTLCFADAPPPAARGVILFIGDGMGLNVVRAAEIYSQAIHKEPLIFNELPIRGVTITRSANSEVTDSAAAITALMSGKKTNNGRLNILPDDTIAYTIPKAAREKGLSIGVVSTTRLTHATPAGVYGHAASRNDEQLIADQFLDLAPEAGLAGGLQYFTPPTASKKSKRTDQRDIVAQAKQKGYTFVSNASELQALDVDKVQKLLGLFSNSHMCYEIDRLNEAACTEQPSLAEMTRAALAVVSKNPKGFFVMVEGGRIDHACHAHDIAAAIHDVIAFDKAVKTALDFQKGHPDVLIIVTADHETGGLGLGRGVEYALDITSLKPIKSSIEVLNKKYARNHGALDALLNAKGFELDEREKRLLISQKEAENMQGSNPLLLHGTLDRYVGSWFGYALSEIISARSKVGWTTFVHTADPVITYAAGPGERDFLGTYDNTDIAKKIFKALGLNQ